MTAAESQPDASVIAFIAKELGISVEEARAILKAQAKRLGLPTEGWS